MHLAFGVVNGDGPIYAGGVSGSVTGNPFVGTRPCGGKTLGNATAFSNILDVGVTKNLSACDAAKDPRATRTRSRSRSTSAPRPPPTPTRGGRSASSSWW